MRRVVTYPFALVLLSSLVGCSVYDESLLAEGGARGYPAPPRGAVDGPDGEELVFALRNVHLDQATDESWKDIGWNLDRKNTTAQDPIMECEPPGGIPTVDGTAGIDNKFGAQLYPILQLRYSNTQARFAGDTLEQFARDSETSGLGAVIIRVRDYNGLADDPQVTVDISQSVFGTQGTAGQATAPAVNETNKTLANGQPLPALKWDGNDWFWVRTDNFVGSGMSNPVIEDRRAYVTNHQVVIRLPDRATIRFVGQGLGVSVQLTDAVAVATMDPAHTAMEVDVGGRWAVSDLIETAQYVGICPTAMDFDLLTGILAGFADLMSDPTQAGTSSTCDALSIGVTFDGPRARIGGVAPADPLPNPCQP